MDDYLLGQMNSTRSTPKRLFGCTTLCTLALVGSCGKAPRSRTSQTEALLPANAGLAGVPASGVAVRFYFQPFLVNYIHIPLVVRVLDPNNKEFNTAAATLAGRTVCVSEPKMSRLLEILGRLAPSWTHTNQPTTFIPVTELPMIHGMEITETYTKGTANASIRPEDVCALLEKLNVTITAARARWEFQRFRGDSDCKVPNFDPNLFPGINY